MQVYYEYTYNYSELQNRRHRLLGECGLGRGGHLGPGWRGGRGETPRRVRVQVAVALAPLRVEYVGIAHVLHVVNVRGAAGVTFRVRLIGVVHVGPGQGGHRHQPQQQQQAGKAAPRTGRPAAVSSGHICKGQGEAALV